jgi:sporulation protein YlmC with PRC-barrel domain
MKQCNIKNLIGKNILGQHGREVGTVLKLLMNIETWQLETIVVKLNRESLEDLHLKKKWFGTQIVNLPVSAVSGVTDSLILNNPLEEMVFSGGSTVDLETANAKEIAAQI